MKLKFLSENELISAIRKEFAVKKAGLSIGIGDDAAVIKFQDKNLILTKDLLIEDIHFITKLHPPFLLGRKSLSVNLSDIAALGGRPEYALLGLGLPSSARPKWIEQFFFGFKSVADGFGVSLVGGDITQARKRTISVTLIGKGRNIIKRSGAKPGQFLFVSGTLGDSKQGLILLKKGYRLGRDKKVTRLLKAFLDPAAQVTLGQDLARLRAASAMIDLSDGLSVDLNHLCQESACGAELEVKSLPISPELRNQQRRAVDYALHGGEDYQLLFSVPPPRVGDVEKLREKYRLTCIGKMIKGKTIYVIDKQGHRRRLEIKGYQHF